MCLKIMATQLFECIFFLLLYKIILLKIMHKKEENLESCAAAEVVAVSFSLQSKLLAHDCL